MAHHDVIVVGASSGGVEALTKIAAAVPADLAAAVFVVMHVRADATSYLPAILNRRPARREARGGRYGGSDAIERVQVDYCVAADEIGPLLARLVASQPDGVLPIEVPLETVDEAGEAAPSWRTGRRALRATAAPSSARVRRIRLAP
jgi:hypothetical protein